MYMFANMFKCMQYLITIMFMINGLNYLTHSKHFSYFNDKFMNVFISIESVPKSSHRKRSLSLWSSEAKRLEICFLFGLLPDRRSQRCLSMSSVCSLPTSLSCHKNVSVTYEKKATNSTTRNLNVPFRCCSFLVCFMLFYSLSIFVHSILEQLKCQYRKPSKWLSPFDIFQSIWFYYVSDVRLTGQSWTPLHSDL